MRSNKIKPFDEIADGEKKLNIEYIFVDLNAISEDKTEVIKIIKELADKDP